MNFGQLIAACYDETGYQNAPSAAVTARYKRWLNEGYEDLLSIPALQGLRDIDIEIATVANQKTYGVQAIETINSMINVTNQRPIFQRSRQFMRDADPAETRTGSPQFWIPFGYLPVVLQPASTGLWVVSSDAADTTQTARIRGVRANGDLQGQATVALNGATRVSIGTFTNFIHVSLFEISAAAAGTVSLYDAAAAGNELARIPIGSTSVQYLTFRLWETPAGVETVKVNGQLLFTELVNDQTLARVKPAFTRMLLTYVKHKDYEKKKDNNAADRQLVKFRDQRDHYVADIEFSGDWRGDRLRADGAGRPSNLGGTFPAEYD